ncbi:hypothetical protein H9L12_08600 [Sphingomonas rhizophila]|uniref:Uncharacterized protein n=1 Tax=Sphingomonas rhizophila TaxID=2071607 RepID=A0A7G9S963_9SPHN|nr:hypothetical protein [Sphingomonas rhizophila]QNN64388.1 hypothetical protein H9L12_08600 [Sphingomonas rhizophila]
MGKIHYFLVGFGVLFIGVNWYLDFPFGMAGMGIALGSIVLGIRQWFMASAHQARADNAFSNAYVGSDRKKLTYHGPDW